MLTSNFTATIKHSFPPCWCAVYVSKGKISRQRADWKFLSFPINELGVAPLGSVTNQPSLLPPIAPWASGLPGSGAGSIIMRPRLGGRQRSPSSGPFPILAQQLSLPSQSISDLLRGFSISRHKSRGSALLAPQMPGNRSGHKLLCFLFRVGQLKAR